ncbi:MAG: radical SAM protein [Candidatus Omnitrophota bacterium]
MQPSYIKLYADGRLEKRLKAAESLLESCTLCPRKCGVNRIQNKKGFCKTGRLAGVYSYMRHFGEEPPITGTQGSGAIFFSGCNMDCVYCQNYKFSQQNQGKETDARTLAKFMLELQKTGCHNINLVTPTHVMPQILEALMLAIPGGLRLPLVYNTGGYELPEAIELLEGVADIYLPDMRYAENGMSQKYSKAGDYPRYNQASVTRMFKQVGIAEIDNRGRMKRGLIIRHLVLPGGISGTEKIMRFIATELSPHIHISLMSQYLPCNKASEFPELSRRISGREYAGAQEAMLKYGLNNGWLQESRGLDSLAGTNIKPIN